MKQYIITIKFTMFVKSIEEAVRIAKDIFRIGRHNQKYNDNTDICEVEGISIEEAD